VRRSVLFIHALSPLHNGEGSGLGAIDRPILRERATGRPVVQGSSLKGVLRDAAEQARGDKDRVVRAAFGSPGTDGNQGCVMIDDASVLFFPARSLAGTFAWTTSGLALASLQRDACGIAARRLETLLPKVAGLRSGRAYGVLDKRDTKDGQTEVDNATLIAQDTGNYVLESLVLENAKDKKGKAAFTEVAESLCGHLVPAGFWYKFMRSRCLLVGNDDFDSLLQRATEVRPNIRIGSDGVTEDGSLRYTEYLPTETVLFAPVAIDRPRVKEVGVAEVEQLLAELFNAAPDPKTGTDTTATEKGEDASPAQTSEAAPDDAATDRRPTHGALFQLGADETTGKGRVRLVWWRDGKAPAPENGGETDG